MVIGFGTGITTGAPLRYPHLEKRVCVELLPAVVRAGDLFPENYNAAHDPKIELRISDGRITVTVSCGARRLRRSSCGIAIIRTIVGSPVAVNRNRL